LAAWRFAQNPAQRCDLHGKVALLDRLARPRRLDQRVFETTTPGRSTNIRSKAVARRPSAIGSLP
jgi:hypothetical protein